MPKSSQPQDKEEALGDRPGLGFQPSMSGETENTKTKTKTLKFFHIFQILGLVQIVMMAMREGATSSGAGDEGVASGGGGVAEDSGAGGSLPTPGEGLGS